MMHQRFIQHVRVDRPSAAETAAEARERLREKFPRASLRRMTHLGLLVGSALDGVAIQADDALVYASTFAETRAMEDFLNSFPAASPLLFQTSIHPGGVQQVLIGRQQPVARLWPLAGHARLVEQALTTALLETAGRVVVIGGEERGTWLLEHSVASERAFAFALVLTLNPANAIGSVSFHPSANTAAARAGETARLPSTASAAAESCPLLPEFADALAERRPLAWRAPGGEWAVRWTA